MVEIIPKIRNKCELEAISVGTALSDRYNSMDEGTDWDIRVNNDYLIKNLGFAKWTENGVNNRRAHGQTTHFNNTTSLSNEGGWSMKQIGTIHSSYWALEDQWLYMMGDSTQRQIWATIASPFQDVDFEKNAKTWSRQNCRKQQPHRKHHPVGGRFPLEGM